jgi:hypothetical protein
MTWATWAIVGLGLLVGEMLTPGGFYFFFFGLGALLTSALVWLGLGGPPWLQWLVFTALSLGCLVPLRSRFVRWASGGEAPVVDSLVGQEAVVTTTIEPRAVGKVELRGTTWSARSSGATAVGVGTRVRVARVDGLTLWVDLN